MQMQPITPEHPITITMTISQWRVVLEALNRPLVPILQAMGNIEQQCQQQITQLQAQVKTTEEMAANVSDQDIR